MSEVVNIDNQNKETQDIETQNIETQNIETQNKEIQDIETQNKNNQNKKNLSRLDGLQNLKRNPPELPFGIVTLQLQAAQMVGRLIPILNDPTLFNKLKQIIHKKFDLTIHNIDNQLNQDTKGGGDESFFTQEECSFF